MTIVMSSVFYVDVKASLNHNLDGGGDTSGPNDNKCSINLEERAGKKKSEERKMPFILKNFNERAYPEGSKILDFGMYELNSKVCTLVS